MRSFIRCSVLGATLAALALGAGGAYCTAAAETHAIVAAIYADGDLASLGEAYAKRLTDAAGRTGWSVAMQLDNSDGPPARLLVAQGRLVSIDTTPADEPVSTASSAALTEFMTWARAVMQADRYIVVVFGHGTSASGRGWDGGQIGTWPVLGLDASAGGDPLEPDELATAIRDGLGGPADLVVLDSCYGASLEVAWALRDQTELILASPGRLSSAGLDWEALLRASQGCPNIAETALRWLSVGGDALALARTDRLEQLRADLWVLSEILVERMPRVWSALARVRSECPTWGSESEMCDLRAFSTGIAEAASGDPALAAAAVLSSLNRCVSPAGAALTMPFPPGIGLRADDGAQGGFGEVSGWNSLMLAYRQRLRDLMHRTDDARRHDGAAT